MELLEAILTAQTCGDACWRAREEVCRCSCDGANHGCLQSSDGVQPTRTSRISGKVFQLAAIGTYPQMESAKHAVEQAAKAAGYVRKAGYSADGTHGRYEYVQHVAERTSASKSQVAKWVELASQRDVPFYAQARDMLWIRVDVAEALDIDAILNQDMADRAERSAAYLAERVESLRKIGTPEDEIARYVERHSD